MGKKALLGTQVHKLIELFLKNELEGYDVQEQYPGFVKQSMIRFNNFKKWFTCQLASTSNYRRR